MRGASLRDFAARRWLLLSTVALSLAVVLGPGLVQVDSKPRSPDAPRPTTTIDPSNGASAIAPAVDPSPGLLFAPAAEPSGAELAVESVDATFECIIEPYELVELGSPVRGVIDTISVDRGDAVESGQVVIELDSGVERARVDLARARAEMDGVLKAREANLALGDRRKTRATQLFERNALSEDRMDQADTEAVVARLELEQARENRLLASLELEQARQQLNRRMIRSPISGVVVERLMSEGETVDEEKMLTIAQLHPLRVEVILPSSMFGTIRPGMHASITPELASDEVHVAEVGVVDKVIDPASGTFGVRLVLPNPDRAIPSGLHCQVRFQPE